MLSVIKIVSGEWICSQWVTATININWIDDSWCLEYGWYNRGVHTWRPAPPSRGRPEPSSQPLGTSSCSSSAPSPSPAAQLEPPSADQYTEDGKLGDAQRTLCKSSFRLCATWKICKFLLERRWGELWCRQQEVWWRLNVNNSSRGYTSPRDQEMMAVINDENNCCNVCPHSADCLLNCLSVLVVTLTRRQRMCQMLCVSSLSLVTVLESVTAAQHEWTTRTK